MGDISQITGCPWTPASEVGSAGERFDYYKRKGLYSCIASPNNCVMCPDSKCQPPNTEQVAAGYTGCGANSSTCYSEGWFGLFAHGEKPPTPGCSEEYMDQIKMWLSNPREALRALHKRVTSESGEGTSAVEAYMTMLFTSDFLMASGHTGWNEWVDYPKCSTECALGEVWNPACTPGDVAGCKECCGDSKTPCCDPSKK